MCSFGFIFHFLMSSAYSQYELGLGLRSEIGLFAIGFSGTRIMPNPHEMVLPFYLPGGYMIWRSSLRGKQ
jgi:hypothetical protein